MDGKVLSNGDEEFKNKHKFNRNKTSLFKVIPQCCFKISSAKNTIVQIVFYSKFELKIENLYYKKTSKTSVFRGFLNLWRKLCLRNSLYIKELTIFSGEPLETQPGFPEVPIMTFFADISIYALKYLACFFH
jgi:hypothetical protein